jgi:hypothetical protein
MKGFAELQLLDVGRDVVGPDRPEPQAALIAPGEKLMASPGICAARIRITDIRREELDVAPAGLVVEIGDDRGHDMLRTHGDADLGLLDGSR